MRQQWQQQDEEENIWRDEEMADAADSDSEMDTKEKRTYQQRNTTNTKKSKDARKRPSKSKVSLTFLVYISTYVSNDSYVCAQAPRKPFFTKESTKPRGRPPKGKVWNGAEWVPNTKPKPRGRPPKGKVWNGVEWIPNPKPRGRPPKNKVRSLYS